MNTRNTNILILKTRIKTKKKVKMLPPFKQTHHPIIVRWSADIEDIDTVLRVEATENIVEKDIDIILKLVGFDSQDLKC